MQETNFQMQWMHITYKLEVNHSTLMGYSAKRLDIPSTLVEETSHTAQVHEKESKETEPTAKHMDKRSSQARLWMECSYFFAKSSGIWSKVEGLLGSKVLLQEVFRVSDSITTTPKPTALSTTQ